MNRITINKADLEFKCDDVYYTEGLEIAKKLKQVALFGNNKTCIGLAHNQIKGNKNVFIAKIGGVWRSFINSKITFYEGTKFKDDEQCMSFPGKSNKILRWSKIELKHQVKARNDNNGSMWRTEVFSGFNACIIQHEVDHLNGIHIFNKNKDK